MSARQVPMLPPANGTGGWLMATLKEMIEKALHDAAKATAAEPTLATDPWHFLDIEHGERRLRDYLRREQARKRRG
jgi:hypothetical protein